LMGFSMVSPPDVIGGLGEMNLTHLFIQE
jgi:hypothetical protein